MFMATWQLQDAFLVSLNCCVSIQGLHRSKDPAFMVFEGESFGETLLTAATVVKC